MNCPRCGTANSVYETRCTRCGVSFASPVPGHAGRYLPERPSASPVTATLSTAAPRPFLVNPQARFSAVISNAVVVPPVAQAGADHPGSYISAGSTARQLETQPVPPPPQSQSYPVITEPAPRQEPQPAPRPQLQVAPPSAQPSLFQPGELPSHPTALRLRPVVASPDAGPLPRRRPERRRAKSDMLPFAQGTLDFLTPSAPPTRQLRTKVDASILCDERCASPTHRLAAGMVDGAYTLIAAAAVALVCWAALDRLAVALPASPGVLAWGLGGIWAAVVLAYHVLFAFINQETPGYRAVGLRIMNLDGSIPGRTERWKRLLAMGASVLPAGVGFVWALCDEEHLAWHDHISGTFATPRSSVESNFRRG